LCLPLCLKDVSSEAVTFRKSVRAFERRRFGHDSIKQVFPGRDKGVRTFPLEPGGEFFIINPGPAECGDYLFGIAAVNRKNFTNLAMIGERKQRLFGNRVDGVGCGERLHIEDIRRLRVFRAGTRPQQGLRVSTRTEGAQPAR